VRLRRRRRGPVRRAAVDVDPKGRLVVSPIHEIFVAGPTHVQFDLVPDEETVLEVAEAWSIDPRALDLVPSESETGLLGRRPSR
jgi:hypothetical protein